MPNRLADSTSPYLLQHRDNPVDWYQWGEEAFAAARSRDVPILLSVGYSACHWCHVMAHESFEDAETAAVMNAEFVNVKVDREERPDVDAIYMEAVQAATGRGGWPMTVFLTPEGKPFYAGTYFPPTDRHGMPSFRKVMTAVKEAWRERRDDVRSQADRLTEVLGRELPVAHPALDPEHLESAYRTIEQSYDSVNGGLGGAPKFPQQPVLEFLLRIVDEPWAPRARSMLGQTLTRMARGGIYDQIGGGFARYAVDASWLVPHFEKMLYDNAQLARLYLWAGVELNTPEFHQIALETLEYLRRDLRHPDGGFFSAEDADSEGEEGRFYVWSREEFLEVAGEEDGLVAAEMFGVSQGGNFEGSNILHIDRTDGEVAESLSISRTEVTAAVERVRHRLFERRAGRVRPGLDFKVITAWNGLAIRAFAEAGMVLGRADLVDDARRAARFILDRARRPDGRLLRSWSRGEARVDGFLDDHAAMAVGLFSLYAVTGEVEWFETATRLVDIIAGDFAEPGGGLYATGTGGDPLIVRPRDQMDNPSPSGSSLAAEAFFLASLYTGEGVHLDRAEQSIARGSALVERFPGAAGHLLAVAHSMTTGGRELAVVGDDAADLVKVAWRRFRPELAVAWSTAEETRVPLLADRFTPGETLAYLCRRFVCDTPTDSAATLARLLEGS